MPSIVPSPSHIGIAIVAPGGYAPDQAAMQRAVEGLQKKGCHVRNYYDPSAKYQRFGAPDAERLAQLHAAAQDPDVQIVLALRGGYGMSRLLPFIDYRLLADSGKLFVGHSDFTALQLALLTKTANLEKQASGRLCGGKLAMVTHLLGTPYKPEIEGGILFFVDISDHPY